MNKDSLIILSILWVVVYFSVASLVLRRRGQAVSRYLFTYGIVAGLGELIQIFVYVDWLDFLGQSFINWLPALGAFILALIFFAVSIEFLEIRFSTQLWIIAGLSWMALILALVSDLVPLSTLMAGPAQRVLILSTILIGWAGLVTTTVVLAGIAYNRARQPLHKNRVIFWMFCLGILAVGDILIYTGLAEIGAFVRIIGIVIAAYVALTHNLIDLLQMGLKSSILLTTTFLAVLVYTGAFLLMQTQFDPSLRLSPVILGTGLALLSVFLVNPLLNLINRGVNRLVFGRSYDPGNIVREFSMGINNIVDLAFLAHTTRDLIIKTFEIERAYLFLVDEEVEDGNSYFRLQFIRENESEPNFDGRLRIDNPVAVFLRKTRLPLTQYDVDYLPSFKLITTDERAWLDALKVDVLVPIFSKNGWIGLLALGPKLSGERFFTADLTLLTTLADQTAVALENARLFSDTIKLNEDLVRAQKALEDANLHLREMDEMKSAFISVVTHELRTPFANMAFSLQLMGLYGCDNLLPEQQEQLGQLNAGVKSARQMVDNLVVLASFLNRQVELSLEPLNLRDVIVDALTPLKDMVKEKGIALQLNIVGELKPIIGDRALLTNAICQLANNAIKFNKSGGKVWVTCWTTSDQICLDIKDTGVGIKAEKLPVLWDTFTQLADPLRRGVEGLGLGLALVKYIVAAHGGQVWAESKEGEGSVFGFRLPSVRTKSLPIHLAVTTPPIKN